MDRLTNRKINSSEPPPPQNHKRLTLQPRTAYPAATNGLPAARRVTLQPQTAYQQPDGLPCSARTAYPAAEPDGLPCSAQTAYPATRRVTLQRTNSLPCSTRTTQQPLQVVTLQLA
jgi:hypothetical protein